MDFIFLFVMFFGVRALFHILKSYATHLVSGKVPPGPFPFPIIGNINPLLDHSPHRSLAKISEKYGPLISLQLGNVFTVVVSSPEIANQILDKNGHVFCNRNIATGAEAHDHHKQSILYLPIGNEWRKLHRICREHVFAPHHLEASRFLGQQKMQKLIDYLGECSDSGKAVDIGEAAFVTAINLISGTLFSIDAADYESGGSTMKSEDLKDAIEGAAWIMGVPNVADYFPILKPIDPHEIRSRSEIYFGKLLGFFQDVINKRLQSRNTFFGSPTKIDSLEILLHLAEGNDFDLSCQDIKHLLLDLIVVGSDTTASTVEWGMTELLLNPEKMSKARNELKAVIGETKQVEEKDISRLPYLQAVIKEILRYHPPCPLLIPRRSKYDVEINGYVIPRDTQVLVNVWAVGRDSNIWSNPDSFEPERFLDSKIDFVGKDFELIPFGSGRRMCPALPLAHRMLHLILANLICNFDWKLEPDSDIDTDEDFGLSLHKAVPLKAIPVMLGRM